MSETWNTTRVNWFPSSWNPFPACAAIQNFTWAKLYTDWLYSVWKGGKPLFGPSLFKEIWYGDHEYKTASIWWQNLKSEASIQSLSNRRSGSCTCSHKSTLLSRQEPLPPHGITPIHEVTECTGIKHHHCRYSGPQVPTALLLPQEKS